MNDRELSPLEDGREYDQAILRWRASPSRTNYALREQARKDYYAYLRGMDTQSEPQSQDVSV